MNYQQFREMLKESPNQAVRLDLPGGNAVPAHFHVTEVGKVTKDFIDCGGTRRTEQTCVLQTLVAGDTHHQLTTGKLYGILEKSASLDLAAYMEVDVEVQGSTVEVYRITSGVRQNGHLMFSLTAKNTACLAMDKCGLDLLSSVSGDSETCCEGQSNCC